MNLPQSKMSTKKCACFTPSGLVYTRLETDGNIARRPIEATKDNSTRTRRSIDNDVFEPNTVDSILKENPSIGHLSSKNEPINEFESRETKDKIDKLIEETEAFLEAYEKTKDNIDHKRVKRRAQNWNHNKQHKQHKNDAITNTNESSLECKVEKNGRVNCSQVIYNDLKAWHTNRLSLEDQIRELRTKLEDLKEIKRHLKTAKPVVEAQTPHSTLLNYQLFSKNISHVHNNSKEHFRKGRLHKFKPKHRNATTTDKRIRQFNEYVIPTVNAKTKEDAFDMQIKNITRNESTTPNITDAVENVTNIFKTELPKTQVTTIVIENNNYFDQNSLEDTSTMFNTFSTTDSVATEFTKHIAITKRPVQEPTTDLMTTERIIQGVQYYSTEINKLIATDVHTTKSNSEGTSTTIKPLETTTRPIHISTKPDISSLGPARLDASEYEQINPNKGTPKTLGFFDKPADVFQRRLHPLFIQNEDKHICYCEEGRLVPLQVF